MKIKIETSNPNKKKTSMLCGFVVEGSDKILGFNKIDSKITSIVKQSIADMGGKFGKISITIENIPSSDNPKTSRLAILSAIQTLIQYCSNDIRIGT